MPASKVTASREIELEIDGHRCPDQYVNDFTPLEFEEIVELFQEFATRAELGERRSPSSRLTFAALDRGASSSRMTWQFVRRYDADHSGEINEEELFDMMCALEWKSCPPVLALQPSRGRRQQSNATKIIANGLGLLKRGLAGARSRWTTRWKRPKTS